MYVSNSHRSPAIVQNQSPLKMPLTPGGLGSSSIGHTSPVRHISRRSSSPGHQPDGETLLGTEFTHHLDSVANSRMSQSFISAGGLMSSGSSASLLPYQPGSGANRTITNSFASSKAKSLSLLIDRATAELNNSGRRRMVAAAAQSSPRDQSANSSGISGSTNVLSYDRDQSLDRHVERRQRHRSHRESAASDVAGRYHTISGYGKDYRGVSADRDYPHMGARALERVEQGMMRSRSIDPEFVSTGKPMVLPVENNSSRLSHDSLIIELQSQVSDLSRECATLQRDLETTRDKLNSSMNSVRTFWSPELKRERAQRKDDSSRLALLVEQIRIAEVENRQLLDTIKHLEKENRTLRDFSLSSYVGTTQSTAEVESDSTRKDREKHMKELKLLKRTIEEMELRIETQKQTLGTRDESIRKLMDMLQAKGRGKQSEDTSEEARHIQQLEQLLEQKDIDMDTKVNALQRELKDAKNEMLKLRKAYLAGDHMEPEPGKSLEKHYKDKLEQVRSELMRSESEVLSLRTKVETLEKHQEDHNRHIEVIRQQLTAKEEHAAMSQSDVDMLHDRLREKDEVLEKKSKLLNALQSDKKHLEAEVAQVSERLTIKEKEILTLQRKIEALEDTIAEKDSLLSTTKARLVSVQADHSASGDAVSGMETLLADKDKQIERLKDQRERALQRFEEEKELASRKLSDSKNRLESLQCELADRQRLLQRQLSDQSSLYTVRSLQKAEAEMRDELLKLKSERLAKESHISRLELAVSENVDQINELQSRLRLAVEEKEIASSATAADQEKQLSDLRKELDQQRADAARIKIETTHLSSALRDAESVKQSKDRQIKQLTEQLEECEQKITALKEKVAKAPPVDSVSENGTCQESINEEITLLKSLIHDRDDRITELEEALRESIRITAQREVVMAEQQMKLEHTERMMESLQEEIDNVRKTAADTAEQLNKARNQITEKDEEYLSLQADSKRQLVEVYEMKQEAILAAISEKDAHIALLEMAPNKKTENIEEVDKLSREKLRLQQVLKDLTQSRMKLLQSRHLRSQSHDGSASTFYKSDSHEKDDDGL